MQQEAFEAFMSGTPAGTWVNVISKDDILTGRIERHRQEGFAILWTAQLISPTGIERIERLEDQTPFTTASFTA